MLPFSIRTFMSFTQAPSTPLSVLVARDTASLMASSKPVSDVALNSVTLATLMVIFLPNPWLAAHPVCDPTEPLLNTKGPDPEGCPGPVIGGGCRGGGPGPHPRHIRWAQLKTPTSGRLPPPKQHRKSGGADPFAEGPP